MTRMAAMQCDRAGSVMGTTAIPSNRAYSPYGHCKTVKTRTLLAYTGQPFERSAHGYLLGNGYRLYVPSLMRFVQADGLSPFNKGGINSYGYCQGDPVNRSDTNGRQWRPTTQQPLPSSNQSNMSLMCFLHEANPRNQREVLHTAEFALKMAQHANLMFQKGAVSLDSIGLHSSALVVASVPAVMISIKLYLQGEDRFLVFPTDLLDHLRLTSTLQPPTSPGSQVNQALPHGAVQPGTVFQVSGNIESIRQTPDTRDDSPT